MAQTLRRRSHALASPRSQRERLHQLSLSARFEDRLAELRLFPLHPLEIDTLQINVGRRCNQTCLHCHVDAGPDRKEEMRTEVVDACLRLLDEGGILTLDITGGAPELHPRFRDIIRSAARLERQIMHRCNLTAILLPAFADIPEFLAEHRVEIVASLPYYLPRQTDAQRGEGVFEASLDGLRRLNDLGYGKEGSGLILNLVTNPVGAFLPANQKGLERDWKRELSRRYGIEFNQLLTITNMPISRFLEYLDDSENLAPYMERLVSAFNPRAAEGVMCRNLISVGYDGTIYDCDFNQMLEIPVVGTPHALSLMDLEPLALMERLQRREIRVEQHCFGCTAGAGSSCGGATA